jgi:hypothetical protein
MDIEMISPSLTLTTDTVGGPGPLSTLATPTPTPKPKSSYYTPPLGTGSTVFPQSLLSTSSPTTLPGLDSSIPCGNNVLLTLANSMLPRILLVPPPLQPNDNPIHISNFEPNITWN